jgi:hypothetical protein
VGIRTTAHPQGGGQVDAIPHKCRQGRHGCPRGRRVDERTRLRSCVCVCVCVRRGGGGGPPYPPALHNAQAATSPAATQHPTHTPLQRGLQGARGGGPPEMWGATHQAPAHPGWYKLRTGQHPQVQVQGVWGTQGPCNTTATANLCPDIATPLPRFPAPSHHLRHQRPGHTLPHTRVRHHRR